MDGTPTAKKCPKCGSGDYAFRGRKKVAATDGAGGATETKYRCKTCEHEWKVKVPDGGGGRP